METQLKRVSLISIVAAALAIVVILTASTHADSSHPRIDVSVKNLTTGASIHRGEVLNEVTVFQVSVTGNGVDCAGQFIVTALGAPGLPPSVLVAFSPFIIGPAAGTDSVTTILNSGAENDWKISASCNGAFRDQITFDAFEFFVSVP